jgi:hypothetical protein
MYIILHSYILKVCQCEKHLNVISLIIKRNHVSIYNWIGKNISKKRKLENLNSL